MADASSKRSSVAARAPVPTPRVQQNQNSPSLMTLDATLNRIVGAKIRVKLANTDIEHVGYVVNVSTAQNSVSLSHVRLGSQPSGQTPSSAGIIMVNISAIESFQIQELAPPAAAKAVTASVVSLTNAEVERNVRAAVTRALEEEANQGKGVTADAQQLYDALHRIFPTRWADKGAFVVNENTLVEPPYGPENCKSVGGGSEKAIAYVKKILESERKKLADKKGGGSSSGSSKIPPEVERKGG